MCKQLLHVVLCVLWLGSASSAFGALIGWWPLDETSGTVARDGSGQGNDGTVVGTASWAPGKIGGALEFDGKTFANCGNKDILNITDAVTLAAWVLPNATFAYPDWSGIIMRGGPNIDTFALYYNGTSRQLGFKTTGTTPNWLASGANSATVLFNGEWHHAAATYDGATKVIYVDGAPLINVAATGKIETSTGRLLLGAGRDQNPPTLYAVGKIDDAQIYSNALTPPEIQRIMAGLADKSLARGPSPTDKATDVMRDAVLSWTPGAYPATHDVYFGSAFADVNTASRTNPKSVLVSKGQVDTTFDPPGAFAYGQTYYWRIDEVNKTPDNTIFKGNVWSFTAEPYGYPIKPTAATASSFQASMGPEKTIDGSGMTGDLHGVDGTTMWLTGGAAPNWIQYEFDKVYKLADLKVWNYNAVIETFMGFGAKQVKIETSTDGTTWKSLANVPEFAKGTGLVGYAANTTVNFGGVDAKLVKLTIEKNWGGLAPQAGLSEVQFSAAPMQAFAPRPATSATGIGVDTGLNWRPGRAAASHKVFFGTDQAAVSAGTAPAKTVTEHSFDPGSLNLGTTYYWKIDEVNAAATYPGEVWSFSTEAYRLVDDFESYSDKTGNEIWSFWIDGFADNYKSSGSTVGLDTAKNGTFGETTIIHGGKQSMPLAYDNTKGPGFSEAVLTLSPAQNWTVNGIKSLSLWFRGVAGNGGQLYVKINNAKMLYPGDAADLARVLWTYWNIDLSKVTSNLSKVTSLAVGIEGAGAKGTVYIDDIQLHPTLRVPITQPVIAKVVRANGQSGTRTDASPITTFTASTAPAPMPLYGLMDDVMVFSDRAYPWSLTPAELVGLEYVLTFNTDKNAGEKDVTYTVTFSKAVTIYLTCDDRITNQQATVDLVAAAFAKPGQFKKIGLKLYVHENATTDRPMSVFAADFPAGTYVFGAQDSGNNFYTILARGK